MLGKLGVLRLLAAVGVVLCLPGTASAGSGLAAAPPTDANRAWCDPQPCVCNDGLACTTDSCTDLAACVYTINAGFCVINGACVSAGTADPQNLCRACNPASSQTEFTPRSDECDDYDACTTNDQCSDGSCAGGPPPVCDDHDKCTIDSCAPPTGCVATAKDCSDGLACTLDSCDPSTGTCVHAKRQTQLGYNGPAVALRLKPLVLSAVLTENGGAAVPSGRSVTFRLGTQLCIGTTDAYGTARCTIVVNQTVGAKAVSASFGGDGCYLAAARNDVVWVK